MAANAVAFISARVRLFAVPVLIRLKVGNLLAEGFHLGNNPRRLGVEGHLVGTNLEYDFNGRAKVGFSFLQVRDVDLSAIGDEIAEKLKTYDFRADVYPTENLALSGELALQRGGDRFHGEGWWVQAKYTFNLSNLLFKPTIAYRYAVTTGDDPNTSDLEGFFVLAYGFTDYETWFQGEITGNWILDNSNQHTHLVLVTAELLDSLTFTGAYLNIGLDEPGALGAGIFSDDFGNEMNLLLDWAATDHLTLTAAMASLFPGDAAKEFTGGGQTWSHFMFYASVSY